MQYCCSSCEKTISERVYDFSIKHFGKALCWDHQKENVSEKYFCSFCKVQISEKVYNYSLRYFGKVLCITHQKDFNQMQTNKTQKTSQKISRYFCTDCKKPITYAVYSFSTKKFEIPLCRDCQPAKEKRRKTSWVPPRKHELKKPKARIEIGGHEPKRKPIHDGY